MRSQESYEATINVRHISTSPKARNVLSLSEAMGRAVGNLRYITRSSAVWSGDVIAHSEGITMVAEDPADRRAAREMTLWALEARAQRNRNSTGIRLADTLIVSLPRDATPDHQREMVANILANLGRDSDAWLIGAIHRDRTGNPHAHILAIDGLESQAAAKARRPEAKRVRRADALRLNEGGNRREIRSRIAEQINAVSDREGYRRAEVRSYEDRGIERAPTRHDGPQKRAIDDKLTAWLESAPLSDDDIFSGLPPQEPSLWPIEASQEAVSAIQDQALQIRQVVQERLTQREAVLPHKKSNIRY